MPNKWAVVAVVGLLVLAGAVTDEKNSTLSFAWFDLKPGIVMPGEEIVVSACIENTSTSR